jgi:hypothetical protein
MASDYYMANLVTNKSSTPQLKKIHLDQFPIPMELIKENEEQLIKIFEEAKKIDLSQVEAKLEKIFKSNEPNVKQVRQHNFNLNFIF